jgi:hypothetical protein
MVDEGGGSLRPHRRFGGRAARPRVATARIAQSLTVLLLAAGALTGALASPRSPVVPTADRLLAHPLVVRGHVRGLYPGASKRIRVVVRNRSQVVVLLERLGVRVGDASRSCAAANVRVRGYKGSQPIPAGGHRRLRLRVRMRASAPNGCQGARFPLTFTTRIVPR